MAIARIRESKAMNEDREGHAAQSYSLLVVDDDLAMREMLGQLFREEGYVVEDPLPRQPRGEAVRPDQLHRASGRLARE